ncbi:MAG: rhomboid family intramembrane serine protease [Verrucomicrobiota bacterium]
MSRPIPNGWHFRQGPVARQFRSPATWFIVATTVISYFVQLYYVFGLDSLAYDRLLAYNAASFERGDWWQIWTYAWLHAEVMPLHIIINLWMIILLGPVLERTIGTLRFVVLYLLAAPASVLAFDLFQNDNTITLVGASGCAFALLAAVSVLYPTRRIGVLLFFILPLRMRLATFTIVICAAEAVMLAFGWLSFIAHAAHLGGAAAGLILALLFRPEENHTAIDPDGTRRQLEAQIGGKPVDVVILPPPR